MSTERVESVVLIVTHSGDHEGVDLVIEAILARGGRVFRFDTDRFPTEVRLRLDSRFFKCAGRTTNSSN